MTGFDQGPTAANPGQQAGRELAVPSERKRPVLTGRQVNLKSSTPRLRRSTTSSAEMNQLLESFASPRERSALVPVDTVEFFHRGPERLEIVYFLSV